jgi:hypothetical protein
LAFLFLAFRGLKRGVIMEHFLSLVLEGIGFGIGWALFQGAEKLWAKGVCGVKAKWTERQKRPIGNRPSANPLAKGLWNPRPAMETPKSLRQASARSHSYRVEESDPLDT